MIVRTRRSALRLLAGALVLAAATAHAAPAQAPTAAAPVAAPAIPQPGDPGFVRYLLDRIDDLHRGGSSHGLMQMKVQTAHWTRAMAMESWSMGEDYSLVRILEPKKERGTATLKAKGDLFTYLSKTGRTIKIAGAMMGGSWMGSHFTNDDLVRGNRLADSFDASVADGPVVDGQPTHLLTLVPRADAPVVWGKIEAVVRKSDLMPTSELFYDEDGKPARRLEFSEYTQAGGRSFPARMIMTPLDKPGEYTEVRFARIEFDIALDRNFFSLQQLQSI